MDSPQKLFDFFGAQNVPEELATYFENTLVEKANMFPQQQLLDVYVTTDEVINSYVLDEAEKWIVKNVFNGNAKIHIIPRFPDQEGMTAKDIIEDYLGNLLWEIKHKKNDVLMYLLLKDADIAETENGVVLGFWNSFAADFKGKDLSAYIQTALAERFGVKVRVTYELQEQPEIMEDFAATQSAERARVIEAIAPRGPATDNKPVKKDSAPQRYQKKIIDSNLFYGKNVDGDITNLEDVEALEGEVIVRGKIVSFTEKDTKTKTKRIVLVSLTDFTDSITVKLFLKPYQAEELKPMLQPG